MSDGLWRRLLGWSVLYFIARFLRQLIANIFALIPAVYGITRIESLQIGVAIGLASTIAVVVYAVIQFTYFRYQVTDDAILVREGILFRKQTNLGFERIQNVSLDRPFYLRPLKLVTLKVDSAGSSGEEVILAALNEVEATRIHDKIRTARQDAAPSINEEGTHASKGDVSGKFLIDRELGHLVLHGLTNNRAWIALAAIGTAFSQFADTLRSYVDVLGIDFSAMLVDATISMLIALAFSALVLSIIIVTGLSIAGSIVAYYGYELTGTATRLTVRRGLLTHRTIHMNKSRVQASHYQQDWLDHVLGRLNLVFEQVSYRTNYEADSDRRLIVPSVTFPEANNLTKEVIRVGNPEDYHYQGVSIRLLIRNLCTLAIVTTSLVLALHLIPELDELSLLPVPFALWLGLLQYYRWKRLGITIDGNIAIVRKGSIGVHYIVIELHKLQTTNLIQTFLMRRRQLSSLALTVASRTLVVPFLPQGYAETVRDYGLYQAEASGRSWM